MKKYQPETCIGCHQTTTYRLGLDQGSAGIFIDIFKAICKKGINEIHPTREIEAWKDKGKKWYSTNLSRPRFHGLIAFVKDKPGYYCLTKKAGIFLRNKPVSRYAIISKAEGHQIGYWEPEVHQITLQELLKSSEIPFWEGDEQRMIDRLDPQITHGQSTLFDFFPQPTLINTQQHFYGH